jgi:hypothetical protein
MGGIHFPRRILSNFEYEYLGEFKTKWENNIFVYESGDQVGSIDEKYQR